MGSIKEGEIKLNNIQVIEKLKGSMTQEQKDVFKPIISKMGYQEDPSIKDHRRFVAHMILDGYKDVPGADTEDGMTVKRCLKHLMTKYMNSRSTMDGEQSANKIFIEWLLGNAGNDAE